MSSGGRLLSGWRRRALAPERPCPPWVKSTSSSSRSAIARIAAPVTRLKRSISVSFCAIGNHQRKNCLGALQGRSDQVSGCKKSSYAVGILDSRARLDARGDIHRARPCQSHGLAQIYRRQTSREHPDTRTQSPSYLATDQRDSSASP